MNILEPVTITDSMMVHTNVSETDHLAWISVTTYALGARVIRARAIWESVQSANTGHDPSLDDGTWWVRISATNRWRAFDGALAPSTVQATLIDYGLVLPVTTDAVALFGLGASEVQINVIDPVDGPIYDRTVSLVSSVEVADAWDYCFAPFTYLSEYIFRDIPAWSGCTIRIRIRGGVNTSVSEIIVGQRRSIGQCLVDTSIGIQDYSIKERDEWGSPIITARPSSDIVAFKFAFPTEDARRLRDLFRRIRAVPAVYDAGDGTDMLGTTILGFYKDFSIPLTTTRSFGVLEVESLV